MSELEDKPEVEHALLKMFVGIYISIHEQFRLSKEDAIEQMKRALDDPDYLRQQPSVSFYDIMNMRDAIIQVLAALPFNDDLMRTGALWQLRKKLKENNTEEFDDEPRDLAFA